MEKHKRWNPGTLMAQAYRDIANEHNATVDALEAALAAGGLVPCAVPEYAPEDVALMPELALLRQKVENQRMQLHNLERREESRKFAAQFAGRASDEELGEALRRELGMEGLPRPVRAAAAIRARVEAPLLAEIERLDIENRDRAFYVEQFAAVSKERDALKSRVANSSVNSNSSSAKLIAQMQAAQEATRNHNSGPYGEPVSDTYKLPTPTDTEVEALARVLREAHAKRYGGVPESYMFDGFLDEARAAFAHIGAPKPAPIKCIFCDFEGKSLADLKEHSAKCENHPLWPTPIAAPDVLEQLAEIGQAALFPANHGHMDYRHLRPDQKQNWRTAVAAILRAAQAYVDVEAGWQLQATIDSFGLTCAAVDFLNSRIRYRVALPETPKGLPTPDEFNTHFSKMDRGLFEHDVIELIYEYLRPWLHEPTGWELDVTAGEIMQACTTNLNGYEVVLDLCRSRIRPTFECAECKKMKERKRPSRAELMEIIHGLGFSMIQSNMVVAITDAFLAALEGE